MRLEETLSEFECNFMIDNGNFQFCQIMQNLGIIVSFSLAMQERKGLFEFENNAVTIKK
ncbi:MAG: hypothetical protein FWH37_06515 [Candidatus Bathyarchaeota archaeon]|nr:hypothetical protein [Candidatus Termiticorpusculum sp.]